MIGFRYTSALIVAVMAAAAVFAQIGGLSGNREYVELLESQKALRARDDSISAALAALRSALRDSPDRRAGIGADIIVLEARQFDVRNRMGAVVSRIGAIEQEYVLRSLAEGGRPIARRGGDGVAAGAPQVPYLIDNAAFERLLRPDDYRLLRESQAAEASMQGFIDRYRADYRAMAGLQAQYITENDEARADSIYALWSGLRGRSAAVADSLDEVWRTVSGNKIYIYSYLLEKMDLPAELDRLNAALAAVADVEAGNRGVYSADAVAFHPIRKALLLDIEMRVAELLELGRARDSLARAHDRVSAESYAYTPPTLALKLFVEFVPVSVSPGRYTARNPIPELDAPDRGTIYRIQVGAYDKPAAVSVFRGLYPLAFGRGEDGRYRYYAGLYGDPQGAAEGLELVRKTGFRDAFVTVWEQGKVRTGGDAAAGDVAAGKGESLYRVEIETGGRQLPAAVRDLIAGTGKELVRLGGTIVVGAFGSLPEAQRLQEAIRGVDGAPETRITTISR